MAAESEAAAAPAACRQAPLAGRAAAVGWEMDDWVAVARVMEDLKADLEGSAEGTDGGKGGNKGGSEER